MSDPTDDKVSDSTRAAEDADEQVGSGSDRMPTPEEEAAAERAPDLDPSVAASYKEQAERGAGVEGEGKIS